MTAWLQTRSGLAFDYEDPKPEQIDIRDIAHSLGLLCRFAGHCSRFYSVAEHSVHCATLLLPGGRALAREGLMHDSHEAYMIDLPSPLKRLLPGYRKLEGVVEVAVRARFGLPRGIHPAVKATDRVLFHQEAASLHEPPPRLREPGLPDESPPLTGFPDREWTPHCWSSQEAASRFLGMFRDLFPEVTP
ncbi:MAG: hypothetical protein ACRBN8_19815 [Nannocystales bacterium]